MKNIKDTCIEFAESLIGSSKNLRILKEDESDLEKIITEDFSLFSQVFNINEFGYWENDNYVLIQNQDLETIAKSNKVAPSFQMRIKLPLCLISSFCNCLKFTSTSIIS